MQSSAENRAILQDTDTDGGILSDAAGLLSFADNEEKSQAGEDTDTPSSENLHVDESLSFDANASTNELNTDTKYESVGNTVDTANALSDESTTIYDLLYPLEAPSAHDDTSDDARKN